MSATLYESKRLAEGYAYHRPPVHQHIIAALRPYAPQPCLRALDLGCGAGLSTAALEPLANQVIGLEPFENMLTHRRVVTQQAHFVVAQAEQLPFASGIFDLVTAAGSLNYADHALCFPEIARVLANQGVLVIYDFSEGRRLRNDDRLERWYATFKERYPSPPGYAMDVRGLDYERYELSLQGFHEIEIAVPLNLECYLRYALSETSVERAIARGISESEIHDWCEATLAEIFDEQPQDVLFDAYFALIGRRNI